MIEPAVRAAPEKITSPGRRRRESGPGWPERSCRREPLDESGGPGWNESARHRRRAQTRAGAGQFRCYLMSATAADAFSNSEAEMGAEPAASAAVAWPSSLMMYEK